MAYRHDFINILVGFRSFLGESRGFACSYCNTPGFQPRLEFMTVNDLSGSAAAHDPAGPMAGGTEALGHGFFGSLEQVGGCTHIPRHNYRLSHGAVSGGHFRMSRGE